VKVKPFMVAGPRVYRHARGSVPSVTEVLKLVEKPYLEQWRRRVGQREANKIMQNAAAFGTKLHKAAEMVCWERDKGVARDMQPYAAAVRTFVDRHVLEVLGTEVELVSGEMRFGGTLDLYCQLKDGSYAVVDWKTSASLTREMGLQTAAYALLAREKGWRVNKRLVVRIKKDKPGAYYMRTYHDHAEDVEAFKALVVFWWWRHQKQMRKRTNTDKHIGKHIEGVA
jgi:predicted RecB family nuclease